MSTLSAARGLPDQAALRAKARRENFPVALRMLPAGPRRQLEAIYGAARVIDDAGDEAAGDRLALLDALDRDLDRAWRGELPAHPAIRRLVPTVRQCRLPEQPLHDLVEANRWDVRGVSVGTRDDLLAYCALSAHPIGRLVLAVAGVSDPRAVAASDAVCAGLQLVEHWQDVGEDAARGRVYLPADERAAYGVAPSDLRAASASPALRRLLAAQSAWARSLLREGDGLVRSLHGWPRLAVAGYVAGGLAALDALARVHYDVLAHRATVRRRDLVVHLVRLLARRGT